MRRLKKLSKRPRTSGLLAGCLAAVALLATASAASAVTYRPTRTDDPAPNGCKKKNCSLREAVIAANASGTPATILLRPGKRYVLTRKGAGENATLTGDLDISSGPLTVKTEGGGKTDQATIDANGIDRIFDGSLTLNGVTLRDGHARTVAGDTGVGGAIRGGTLDIRNSRLVNNTTDDPPSHIFADASGGAIFVNSGGEVKIDRTRLKGNKAAGPGGAIFISRSGSASLFKSTLARNQSAYYGGGLGIDAGAYATVNRSAISGNNAGVGRSAGGGIGINAPEGGTTTLEVENSTVANNSAGGDGGGISTPTTPDSGSHATVVLDHVTIVRNEANLEAEAGVQRGGEGGGIYAAGLVSFSVHNSVVALNTVSRQVRGVPGLPSDCTLLFGSPFLSLGHNLIGNADGCTGFGATDLFGGKLGLGKLADNGGPTKTIALMKGSRAIGHGEPDAVRVDQRGVKRGNKPDIGAYERRAKK
ncbi:MAG: right-handed parallel beta-helix repeat-containing protein [Solirubrobacterales bacterium]